MPQIGDTVRLSIVRKIPGGLILDADNLGEILLPNREQITEHEAEDQPEVFLYRDSENRPVATEKRPHLLPGEFGVLKVIQTGSLGAFLDWGLAKDLLLPFSEQNGRPKDGQDVVVHVHLDPKSNRLVASQRISRHFEAEQPPYKTGDEADLLVFGKTDLGYKVIVDQKFSGLLFHNQVFENLSYADHRRGWVTEVRPDGRLNLSLRPPGNSAITDLEDQIERELEARGGFWDIDDKTPAETIYAELGVSKKVFKRATGALFKKRRITFTDGGIRSTDSAS